MKRKNETIRSAGIVILVLLLSLALPAVSQGADVMNNFCSTPPFIVGGVTPNLMLMIDNSASMFDLTYVDRGGIVCSGNNAQYCDSDSDCAATGSGTCDVELRRGNYCYDQTYQFGEHYEGYFQDWFVYYEYDFVNDYFVKVPVFPGACDKYVASTLCIDIGWNAFGERAVIRFVAEGNYLNWLAASKFDVQKKILTGGKYQAPFMIAESRGCVGRKFIKEALAQQSFIEGGANPALGITFGVRGPKHPYSETSISFGGTTEIDIFEGDYDQQLCGDAINSILDDENKQTIQDNIEACLEYTSGKHCSLNDSIPCNQDNDCDGDPGTCDIFNDGVCNIPNDGVCNIPDDGSCTPINDGVCDIFNDGVCNVVNDGVCNPINDGVCNLVPDGICNIPNDGVCGAADNGVCGIVNDGVCNIPNDGICNTPNDGVCSGINDGICNSPNDGICNYPNDGICNVPNDGSCDPWNDGVCDIFNDGVCNFPNDGVCQVVANGVCELNTLGVCTADNGVCSAGKMCIGGADAGNPCNNKNDCDSLVCTRGCVGGGVAGSTCNGDNDCFYNECTAGKVGNLCNVNADCNLNTCTNPGNTFGNVCVVDPDCNSEECTAGDAGKIGDSCLANAECDSASTCSAGQVGNLCAANADCNTPSTCSAGQVGNLCADNADCDTPGSVCTAGQVGLACAADFQCNSPSTCSAGQVGLPCVANAQCNTPSTCTAGQVGLPCAFDAQCNSAGNECTAGQVGLPCVANADCNTPSTCSAGQVGLPCVANPDCDSPSTCTAGQVGLPCAVNTDCNTAVGVCTAPPPSVGDVCVIDDDCNQMNTCAAGLVGDPCKSHDECDSPSVCTAGLVGNPCAANPDCNTPSTCTAGQVGLPCADNADCNTIGSQCTAGLVGNPCAANADCNTPSTCSVGQVGNPCAFNAECNTPSTCSAGLVGNPCAFNPDCNTPGSECTAGDPGKSGDPCVADADCDTPSTCSAGQVGLPCVADAQCDTASTCTAGDAGKLGNPCATDDECDTPSKCSAPAVNFGKPCALDADCATFYGVCQQPVTQQIKSTFSQSVHECYQYWNTGGFLGTDYLNIIANPSGCNQIYKEYKICNGGARDGEICAADADCIGGGLCVHGPDHIRPGSAALVCSTAYTGYCAQSFDDWDTTNWIPREYADADACITAKFEAFCTGAVQPPVVDPTDDPSTTEEYDNLPAIIADLGVENQLGQPIGTLMMKLEVAQAPSGLIQEFEELIHFGAMSFNYYGSTTECPGDIPCTKVCQGAGTVCTVDNECPIGDPCVNAADLDGGQITDNGYIMGHCSITVATTCNKNTHCPAGETCVYDIGDHTSGLINDIDGIFASTWTPFAEGFYNTIGYFAQRADKRLNATDFILESEDPDYRDPVQYSCQKNNVLLISDGMSTADLNANVNNVVFAYNDGDGEFDNAPAAVCPKFAGSRNVDDLAWLAKNKNIEDFTQDPDPDFANSQTLTTHVVFNGVATADPGECNPDLLMNETADNGGGTYQRAENPQELRDALRAAFQMIAGRAASGTAASVLASGEGTGANLVQAIFYPERSFFGGDEILWTGSLKNLWYHIDPLLGNSSIREDKDIPPQDFELRLNSDRIIHFFFDTSENLTKANLFADSDADGAADNPAVPDETVFFENVSSLWEAGLMLWNRTSGEENLPGERLIYTTIDNGSTRTNFVKSNAAALRDFLQVATNAEAERLILYARGYDKFCSVTINRQCETNICPAGETCETPFRNRTVMNDINQDGDVGDVINGIVESIPKVWKLGDIVNATPRIISWVALNGYDKTYDDTSYEKFIELPEYQNRGLVIVGANDGMLHGFNLGTLEVFEERYKKAALSGGSLGEEDWAFIPQNVLPYLKYFADPGYCHVYTLDLTPYVFDASIGNGGANYWDAAKNENSWRTIVIGGMRIGGACKDACGSANCVETPGAGKGYSSYFALDITDKNAAGYPKVLWEFSSEELGFATTGPAIVRISARDAGIPDNERNGRWFVVFGSGPTGPIDTNSHQFKGFSDQELKLFVLDLADGTLVRTINSGIPNAFAGSLVEATMDYDQNNPASEGNYQDDVLYFGFVKAEHDPPGIATTWNQGGVLRLATYHDLDPNNWQLTTFFEGGPVTSAISKLQNFKNPVAFLFWGEGRYYYKISDVIDDAASPRRIYGVQEPCFGVGGFDTAAGGCLTIPADRTVDIGDLDDATAQAAPAGSVGWYIDLDVCTDIFGNAIGCGDPAAQFMAERVVTDTLATPIGAVFYTTTKPAADVCEFGGTSHLWAVDWDTGGAVSSSVLRGKAVMQVSTASIEEVDLKTAFTEKTDASTGRGRRTSAFQGVPPAGSPPGILVPPDPVNRFIHIFEK